MKSQVTKKAFLGRGRRVFVAMSGGVDSSLTASILKEHGYEVVGVFMRAWSPPGIHCISRDDRFMAARVAARLGIPFLVWDFSKAYKQAVVDAMVEEYRAGRTPNPDVVCNQKIKFGLFLKRALASGADVIATGHYVRLKRISTRHTLYSAKDANKDQSYFLWTLTQTQLARCLFPIGEYKKSDVRAMAKKRGLPSWNKKDSQGLCFVGTFSFSDFLSTVIPAKEGSVRTPKGEEIGRHQGAHLVTIGQRHGLNIGTKNRKRGIIGEHQTKAHYVVTKNIKTNTVVVAEGARHPALFGRELVARKLSWVAGHAPRVPFCCRARIRYREPLQAARVSFVAGKKNALRVRFTRPQRAIAPGQSVVFYRGARMLGGGVIALEK